MIKTLFCDVGGVLLTNGWGHTSRAKAAEVFDYDAKEFEDRHQLIFPIYEIGKISLEDYLKYCLFFKTRAFTMKDYIDFMYSQSKPFPDMIELVANLKKEHHLKVVILSNEGRELTEYRLREFHLDALADFFVVSSFIGLRKPDVEIYHKALELSQTRPKESLYFDDRILFVEMAKSLSMHAIQHVDAATTKAAIKNIL